MDTSGISSFHITLLKISRELSTDELRELTYLCKDQITVAEKENIKNAITLFELLEKKGIISEDDSTFLMERMKNLQREDLRRQLQGLRAEHELGATTEKMPQDCKDSRPRNDDAHSQDEPRKPTTACPTPGVIIFNHNSPMILGDSVGNKFYYDQARASSQTQYQYNVPNAGSTVNSQDVTSSPSGHQQGQSFGQLDPKSGTLKAPADFDCKMLQPKTDEMHHNQQDRIHYASSCNNQGSGRDPIKRKLTILASATNSAPLKPKMKKTSNDDSSPVLDLANFTNEASQSATPQESTRSQTDLKETGSNDGIPIVDWPNVLSPQPLATRQDDESSSLMKKVYNPNGTPRTHVTPQIEWRESSPEGGAEVSGRQSLGQVEVVASGVRSNMLSTCVSQSKGPCGMKAGESSENVAVDDVKKKPDVQLSGEQPKSRQQDDLETHPPGVLKDKASSASPTTTESKDEVSTLSQDDASVERGSAPQQALMETSAKASQISGLSADVSSGSKCDERAMGETEGAAENMGRVQLWEYQNELAYYPLATGGNYIICAPTGSGKTLTAASICYENYLKFQSSAASHKYFKALFIVNIRHLKDQQKNAFQKYFLDTQAARTIGDQQSFKNALMKDEPMPVVLMLTAQIVVNALRQKTVTLEDLDMLIFDECHHTDLQHPYNVIMKTYLKQKTSLSQEVGEHVRGLPQVIGLSASLGVGRGQSALTHVLNLCANMDVRDVIRVRKHKKQLDEFVKVPEHDDIMSVHPRVSRQRRFGSLLEEIMSKIEEELGEAVRNSLPHHAYGCQQYETAVIKQQEESPEHGDVVICMHLNAYNKALMLYEDLPVRDCLKTLEDFHNNRLLNPPEEETAKEKYCRQLFDSNLEEMEEMATAEGDDSNQKLQKLIELLTNQFTQHPNSKGIVLTRMKVATVALCEFIRSSPRLKQLERPIKPERLVGQGALEEHCMTESEQKMVLDNFREEDGCNVLVATDIAQEGLDMPACNFVIRYNFVSNEIGTVQSKGRARAEGSNCFLIVESGSANEKREYENRDKVKNMEKAMNALEEMKENEKLAKIKQRQEEIVAAILQAERQQQQLAAQMNLEKVILKCAECKTQVCKASDLRRKGAGGYVTCIDPGFMEQVVERKQEKTERHRDTQSVSRIMCGSPSCKMTFGTKETFFLQTTSEGFNLRAKSFIVLHETGVEKKLKKWKDLPITEDEDI